MKDYIEHLQEYTSKLNLTGLVSTEKSPYQWFTLEDIADLKNTVITGKFIAKKIYDFSVESGVNKQDISGYTYELFEILEDL